MGKPGVISTVLCDLDGVVWLAHQPIPGSVEAISRLREAGVRVVFVTNNSFSTRREQHEALRSVGVEAEGDVVTSAMAAADHVRGLGRVLVCGGPGLAEEVEAVGADVVVAHRNPGARGPFDAVVVGMHREFDYQVLSDALSAVENGALLVGSNEDPTYPTTNGVLPGGGSILAAISHASGRAPVVTGKPHKPMAEMVLRVCGHPPARDMVMIGDRPDTDGNFAQTLGCRFALVLSGVTNGAEAPAARSGDAVVGDLRDAAQWLLDS